MAATEYGVNHPMAVRVWERRLKVEALKATWISKFIGNDPNALIQRKTDLKKGPGDNIRNGLRVQLTGAGVQGDATLEGQEEAMSVYTDTIYIDQLRHAVRTAGKMSKQRVPFDVRMECMSGLADWWADRIDTWAANQLAGYTDQSDTRYTGNQAAIAPDASHIFAGGGHDTEASLTATTTNILKLSDIDRCVAMAKTFGKQTDGTTDDNMPIRPVRIDGGEYWVMLMHPDQVYQLRTDTNTNQWAAIQQAAMQGGQITNNPLFTGALGMWNNVILHEWSRIPNTTGAPSDTTSRRAVFCGAQAATVAFGREGGSEDSPNWFEEMFDYGNQLGVAAGLIGGLKKNVYDAKDFGTIVVATHAPSLKN